MSNPGPLLKKNGGLVSDAARERARSTQVGRERVGNEEEVGNERGGRR